MVTARPPERPPDEEGEEGVKFNPEPNEEQFEYIYARLRSLSSEVRAQDEARRRLVLYLVILAYVFVFAYLMGRDNAGNRGA